MKIACFSNKDNSFSLSGMDVKNKVSGGGGR